MRSKFRKAKSDVELSLSDLAFLIYKGCIHEKIELNILLLNSIKQLIRNTKR